MNFLLRCRLCTAVMLFICTEILPVCSDDKSSALTAAQWVKERAEAWYHELCVKHGTCVKEWPFVDRTALGLPMVTTEYQCFPAGFEREACLRSISSGLFAFLTHLKYLEEKPVNEAQALISLSETTDHLANTLKSMMLSPEQVTQQNQEFEQNLSLKLAQYVGWTATMIKHVIIKEFISFMEETVRAIDLM